MWICDLFIVIAEVRNGVLAFSFFSLRCEIVIISRDEFNIIVDSHRASLFEYCTSRNSQLLLFQIRFLPALWFFFLSLVQKMSRKLYTKCCIMVWNCSFRVFFISLYDECYNELENQRHIVIVVEALLYKGCGLVTCNTYIKHQLSQCTTATTYYRNYIVCILWWAIKFF